MSQSDGDAFEIAKCFVAARQAGGSFADYPGAEPESLANAYAIQDAAIPLFGGTVAGWKVGRINPPWLEKLGEERLSGPIFANAVQPAANGHLPKGEIFAGGFGAAEAEFVFRIGTAPKAGKAQFSLEEAAALIDAVFAGIEVASSPFVGINAHGPLVTISDFGNNNGLLLGPEIPHWQNAGIEDWLVETRADGAVLGTGKASSFPNGLRGSVRFLVENLIARGIPVTPGTLISTGAVTGVHEVSKGQSIEARFGNFCTLRCVIDHSATD